MPKLRQEIAQSKCQHVLLSSAHLSSALRDVQSIQSLVRNLQKLAREVRLIIYIRPQHELHTSLYSTQVKGGRIKQLASKLGHQTLLNYDYNRKLKMWDKALGPGMITVRLFGRSHFKNGDLLDDFFDALRFPIPESISKPRNELNRRLDAHSVEFLRTVNTLDHLAASKPGVARRALVKRLEDLSEHTCLIMPAADLRRLDEHFRASNDEIARRYFPDKLGSLFPPFQAKAPDPPSELTAAKAVEIGVRALELVSAEAVARKAASLSKAAAAGSGSGAANETETEIGASPDADRAAIA